MRARAVRKDVAPTVSVLPVSDISETSVTFNGRIDNNDAVKCSERGFVYSTTHLPTVANTKVQSYTPQSSAEYSAEVRDLSLGSVYYIRAYAVANRSDTVYSDELTFRYDNQLPIVSTQPVTDIGATTAVLHGSIESKGIPAYTERGFVYSTVFKNPTIESDDKVVVNGTGVGEFSANLSGLDKDVTYYVRAYATNSEGTAYGEAVSFEAVRQLPVVTTLPVTDIDETTAVLHGSVEVEGIPAYTERGFVYSTSFTNPTIEAGDKVVASGNGIGEFEVALTELVTGVKYYVRAYAINSDGIAYGESVSFYPSNPDYVILQDAGLMVQRYDLGDVDWNSAKLLCENSTVGGYNDWRLPTNDELGVLYNNREYIGNFDLDADYWSSTATRGSIEYSCIDFGTGEVSSIYFTYRSNVRAVRSLP